MNTQFYPNEVVPLQNSQHGQYPHQPGVSTVVQSTSVNISTEPPRDHIIWSLCCFVYGNPFCLGLAALIYSIKARDRKMAGNLEGARSHGSTARSLNIAATVITSIGFLIFIIMLIVGAVHAASALSSYENNYRNYRY